MTSIAISDDRWKRLPWKKFQKNLFRLQKRIYKAQRAGNYKVVRMLQKLVLKSQAAKLLAIRQITQLNTGRSEEYGYQNPIKSKDRLEYQLSLIEYTNVLSSMP